MRYATAPAAASPSRAISTTPVGPAYLPGNVPSSSWTFWKLMSSESESTYSRNSASTTARSSGQRASEMRRGIASFHRVGKGAQRRAHPTRQTALSVHAFEELAIRLGVAQLVEQEVDRIHGAHRIE